MVLNWVSVLTLVGCSQGILLAAVLMTLPSGNLRANRILAAIVAVQTATLGVFFLVYTPVDQPYPFFVFRLATIHFLTGPLLYFYIRYLVKPDNPLVWRDCLHLLPFLLAFISTFLMAGPEQFQHAPFEQLTHDIKIELALRSLIGDLVLLTYAAVSLIKLRQHRKSIEQQFSSLEKVTLQWLQVLVLICVMGASLSLMFELVGVLFGIFLPEVRVVAVVYRVILLYGIGFMGMRQPLIFEAGSRSTLNSPPESESNKTKYQRSGLTEQDVQRLWQKLESHMATVKSYRTQGLKVGDLAAELGMRENYLSQVINSCARKNFFEFINEYRLNEARSLLIEAPEKPISEVALEVGFASQNAFNNQFKKHLQQTPSSFRKNYSEN
ncbi:AraC family transcriptional regulator [Endozoicomonas arenosclerae]|uniref:AraC family transcriptional regulator n=1 Tax=Endozoicomonas arenosclerae TaxID=1633495 RepID=UPI0007862E4A|nr:helix-turn-helix domain-containing protein [Endozoicomonas arenosclerae]